MRSRHGAPGWVAGDQTPFVGGATRANPERVAAAAHQ